MPIDSIIGVTFEGIAFAAWAYNLRRLKELKYRLFSIYLGVIWVTEAFNLFFWKSDKSISNIIVNNFNVVLQFIFLFYFFIVDKNKITQKVFFGLSIFFLILFAVEKSALVVTPVHFPSLSFGIGNLLLTGIIIFKVLQMFKTASYNNTGHKCFHLIVCGTALFYIGGFPYQNFRNYFWSDKSMYDTAYLLHYITQFFCYCMYLLFAISVKWKIK